jgi:hypothetical protein
MTGSSPREPVHQQADGEDHGVLDREPGDQCRHRMKAIAPMTAIRASAMRPTHLSFEGRLLALDTLGERGDSPELGVHPGRVDERACLTLDAARSREDEIAGFQQGDAGVLRCGVPLDRLDSPVRVDMSTSRAPSRRRAWAEIRSPSSISRTSPGTSSWPGSAAHCRRE